MRVFFCLRLWSSCGDIGEASFKDCFVLVPCTGCVCLGELVLHLHHRLGPDLVHLWR